MPNVENINTVPGEDEFYFDIRLLPQYDPEECVKVAKEVGRLFEKRTGATIEIEAIRIDPPGRRPAWTRGREGAHQGGAPGARCAARHDRIGGQTCANWFRQVGLDAYVWETLDETAPPGQRVYQDRQPGQRRQGVSRSCWPSCAIPGRSRRPSRSTELGDPVA
jgi:acetylornithine deacetylase/succinyl-diaminopimelate desuccinylase-like protein